MPPPGVWGGGLTPLSDPCSKPRLKTQGGARGRNVTNTLALVIAITAALSGSRGCNRDIIEPSSDVQNGHLITRGSINLCCE